MMLHWNKLLKVLWLNNLIIGTNQTRQNGGFFFSFLEIVETNEFLSKLYKYYYVCIDHSIHEIHTVESTPVHHKIYPKRVSRVTSNTNWRPRFPSSRSLFRKNVSRVPERLNGIIKQESVDMDMGGSSEGHGSRLWSPGRGTHRSKKGIRRFT